MLPPTTHTHCAQLSLSAISAAATRTRSCPACQLYLSWGRSRECNEGLYALAPPTRTRGFGPSGNASLATLMQVQEAGWQGPLEVSKLLRARGVAREARQPGHSLSHRVLECRIQASLSCACSVHCPCSPLVCQQAVAVRVGVGWHWLASPAVADTARHNQPARPQPVPAQLPPHPSPLSSAAPCPPPCPLLQALSSPAAPRLATPASPQGCSMAGPKVRCLLAVISSPPPPLPRPPACPPPGCAAAVVGAAWRCAQPACMPHRTHLSSP
jgi:hypothetical protein